jgi:hypothetical protein
VTTRTRTGTYQMWWDCDQCGTEKLLGVDHRHCPNCGQVQNEDRRYFPPQSEAVPTKYNPHPDHECPYCGAPSSAAANNCCTCGGPMDGSEPAPKRPTTRSTAGETVDAPDRALESRQRVERDYRAAFHAPEAQSARERERAREQDLHKEREQRRADEYERTRAAAEQHNRDQGNLWKEREGFDVDETDEPEWKQPFVQQYKRHLIVGGIVTLLVGLIWMFFFWQKTITAEVTGAPWQRAQVIEQFKTVQDSAWCSSKPLDARNISRRQKVHHHETVTDCYDCDCHSEQYQSGSHQECHTERQDNGNGSFSSYQVCTSVPDYSDRQVCVDRTHQEPVYEAWCTYDIDRWKPQRTPTMSGGEGQEPTWPKLEYKVCRATQLGCERPGTKSQWYKTEFKDLGDPDTYECEWPQSKWKKYRVGSQWEAIVKVVGGRFQCDSLEKAP